MSERLTIPDDSSQQIRVDAEELGHVLEQILSKKSLFQFDASVAVKRMIETDLYGIASHGCMKIIDIVEAIDIGDVDPRARVLIVNESDVISSFDGGRALGQIAATKGIEAAIAKAKSSGVGVSSIGNSQSLGALSVYLRLAASEGLIAIGMSSTGGATITSPGTTIGTVGNSAFAYAVPRQDALPIVFDSACGSESWGKVKLLKRFGVPIPDGIAFDAEGNPTTDIDEATTMSPAGNQLGFGLSLLCSILAGPLSDGQMAIKKKRSDSGDDSQHFFIVFDIGHFTDPERFHKRMESAIEEMKSANESLSLPGERGAECFQKNSQTGIPLHTSVVEEIRQLAMENGVDVTF